MSWIYVGQATLFGPGTVWFQTLIQPESWVRFDIPFVSDQYTQQWGVAFAWTDSTQLPGSGYSVLSPTRVLYNKRTIWRLPSAPAGQLRVGVYRTAGARIAVQDVIVNRWQT